MFDLTSDLGDVVRPIAKKAIQLYHEDVIEHRNVKVPIGKYIVKMYNLYFYIVNTTIAVEVGIPDEAKTQIRWVLGIKYHCPKGIWIEKDDNELTTMGTRYFEEYYFNNISY